MLKNVPISLSGSVIDIKLALKLCHFDILSKIGGGMDRQYFLHNMHYDIH